jgi:hypothetical protein
LFIQLIALVMVALGYQPATQLKELLPGLFVGEGIVEFDGIVPIDCHNPETPDVYLEMLVTAPDSREHESLVMASIKPSNLHAALLAAGLEAGKPITRDDTGKMLPATGDPIRVFVAIIKENQTDAPVFVPIEEWVIHVESGKKLSDSNDWHGVVFAGSIMGRHGYAADRAGTLVSLTSFGNEVVAPAWTLSPEADIAEPVWIANRDLVPKKGTAVRVRLETAADEVEPAEKELDSHEPEGIDIDRDP